VRLQKGERGGIKRNVNGFGIFHHFTRLNYLLSIIGFDENVKLFFSQKMRMEGISW
jgi:hypothetical protein